MNSMNEHSLTDSELEAIDLWDMVDKIKEKILWETENDDKEIQAMMISFVVNQVIKEFLDLSIDFTTRIVLHK